MNEALAEFASGEWTTELPTEPGNYVVEGHMSEEDVANDIDASFTVYVFENKGELFVAKMGTPKPLAGYEGVTQWRWWSKPLPPRFGLPCSRSSN